MGCRSTLVLALGCSACFTKPDPPSGATITNNIAFVTSTMVPANTLTIAMGDAMCAQGAIDGRLPGHYRAWMSQTAPTAPSRLGNARGWVRTDGKPFVDQIGDLLVGRIYYPLRLDEAMRDVGETTQFVATGTNDDGTDSDDCNCYSGTGSILVGRPDGTTGAWTDYTRPPCDSEPMRVYCFGIDLSTPLPPPEMVTPHRLAFLTTNTYSIVGIGGLAGADQACTTEAAATGTFLALVSTATGSPIERFTLGAPWVRPDGVVVVKDTTGLLAPINVTFDVRYQTDRVWTGTHALSNGPISSSDNCSGWISNTSKGVVGTAERSDEAAFGTSTGALCTEKYRLYCLEQ